jgi:uncharacterized protein YkwD
MFAWIQDLDAGQRRVLGVLAAVVAALALAAGAVVLGDDDPGEATVQTDDDATSTTKASSTTSSSSISTTSTSSSTSTTVSVVGGGSTTTTRRSSGGGTVATTRPRTTAPPATTPPTNPPSSGPCVTGGGSARDIAERFCDRRASLGLPTMSRNAQLDQMAQEWAAVIAEDGALTPGVHPEGDHRPNAEAFAMVKARCACTGWAENLAYDSSADGAWNGWLQSTAGHRQNIEDGRDGEFGIGVTSAHGSLWFVMMFGYY